MTDTTNGRRALPWRSEGYRILDADGIEVANTRTRDLASKTVAKDIVDDVNAYYGVGDLAERPKSEDEERSHRELARVLNKNSTGEDFRAYKLWYLAQEAANRLDAKDARIAELEGRAQVAEELVKKLQKEAGARAIMVHEVNKQDARIAELERQLSEASRNAKWMADANQRFEVHIWGEQKRAEDAEADRDAKGARIAELERAVQDYRDHYVHQYLYDDLKRLKDVAEKRAEAAEARVRELEREYYLTARSVGFGWQIKADRDTFTAPDGRVFRVGQRVYDVVVYEYARVAEAPGGAFPVELQWEDRGVLEPLHADHIGDLRRVWDGLEEPDVPVGTVLRDSYGCYLKRLRGTRWELRDDKGDLVDNDEWINLDGEQFRPYVEWLEGDE